MYSLLSKLTEYVFGAEERDQAQNTINEEKTVEHSEIEKTVSTPQTLQTCTVEDEDARLTKSCYGKVTRLYDGAGVIDDEIYFTFDVIIGGFRPELGSEVHLDAARENSSSGWKATRVTSFQEWDSTAESGTIENVIGMVNNIKGDILELNDGLTFSTASIPHQSYSPCTGDWIKIDLERFKDDSFEIRGVKPLREKSFSGRINSVFPGYGFIDEEVFFAIGVCSRGYRPCRGENVQVTAIESMQGKCKWRAILVEPKRNVSIQQNGPVLGSLQQFMGNKMTELLSDKEGLVVYGTLDFGEVPMSETRTISLLVRNSSEKIHTFKSYSFMRADPQFAVELTENKDIQQTHAKDDVLVLSSGMKIPAQETRCLIVNFSAQSLGRVKQLIVLSFDGCEIGRYITSNVIDNYQATLAPMAPYQRNRAKGKEAWDRFIESSSRERWIIPGERPTRKTKIIFPIKLKMYNIPSDIRQCIIDDGELPSLVPALQELLTMHNHRSRFNALLHAEELQMELDMREFDLENVTMDLCGEFLSLHVPGLAEGRPSLLIGDTVVVRLSDDFHDSPRYEGYIHQVRKDDVLLKFHDDFHNNFGLQPCDVTFFFNRSSIRRAHQAVEFALQLGPEVMFPRKLESKLPVVSLFFESSTDKDAVIPNEEKPTQKKMDFLYNSNLNERQRAAVSRILSGQCRPTPYILFGPPGTGKTVTLVEAILQVFHRIPASRIIACAPSNSASDLLAVRLHRSGFIQEGDMVRLNAFQRGQEIPEAIASYCLDTDSLMLAAHYRIIISTCSTSGQLFSLGLRAGHFTHVFIDEAGQATEPECLVPIGLAAGGDGQIILAGDPHQLGPVLRSSVAIEYGLNMSLLERLMSRPLYTRDEARFMDHGCYDPLLVTKLVNNYRSHPSLLHLPSALFYHGELRVFADKSMRESLSEFEMLPKRGTPIVFHGIKGEDIREGSSPSWFNPAEAVQVVRYIQGLKKSAKLHVKPTDIGIVTPYKKQVEKIRLLLRSVAVSDIKVGSVEEFQGQERPVIIISTVRSDASYVRSDVTHAIGFLSNPKRFNVATTRAQCLLVVIGNPHVLCQDPYWCSLLHYCVMNDVYTGCDLPDLNSDLYQEEFHFAMDIISRIVHNEDNKDEPPSVENCLQDELLSCSDCPTSTTNDVTLAKFPDDKAEQVLAQTVSDKDDASITELLSDEKQINTNSMYPHGNTSSINHHSDNHHGNTSIMDHHSDNYHGSNNIDSNGSTDSLGLSIQESPKASENANCSFGDSFGKENPIIPDNADKFSESKIAGNDFTGFIPTWESLDSEVTIVSRVSVDKSIIEPPILSNVYDIRESFDSTSSADKSRDCNQGNNEVTVTMEAMTSGECNEDNNEVTVTMEAMATRLSADGLKMLLGIQCCESDGFHSQSRDMKKIPTEDLSLDQSNPFSNVSKDGSQEQLVSMPTTEPGVRYHGNSTEVTSETLKMLLGIKPLDNSGCGTASDHKPTVQPKEKRKETGSKSSRNESKREHKTRSHRQRSCEKTSTTSDHSRKARSKDIPSRTRRNHSKSYKATNAATVDETSLQSPKYSGLPVVSTGLDSSVGIPVSTTNVYQERQSGGDDDEDDLEEFLFKPATGH